MRGSQARRLFSSLRLIRVERLQLHVLHPGGSGSERLDGEFTLGGSTYRLAITDPVYGEKARDRLEGAYLVEESLLTISLGEPLAGFCYKLIAGHHRTQELRVNNSEVFSVGHSNRSDLDLVELLRKHAVTAVVDVRSTPHSEWVPQFNRSAIAATLKQHGIAYSFLGDQLGVRTDDPACYQDGRVVYERLARTEQFQQGLRRVIKAAGRHRLALMCAEQNPLECHRSILIAPALERAGVAVSHILHPDGELQTQRAMETQLLNQYQLNQPDMFLNDDERLAKALSMQERRIAYVRPTVSSTQKDAT